MPEHVMNSSTLSKISNAVESIARGKTVEFTWRGERVKAGADATGNLLDGIRYLLGGGEWTIVDGSVQWKRYLLKSIPVLKNPERTAMSKEKRVLWLTLKKEPFEVMVTGEKMDEFRKPSRWIMRRLFVNGDPSQGPRHYDSVLFVNGYGKHRPSFERKYGGCILASESREYTYSNGLIVRVERGDIIIQLKM